MEENKIICHCIGVSQKTLHTAIEKGEDTLGKLKDKIQVASTCKHCVPDIKKILKEKQQNTFTHSKSIKMMTIYTKDYCPYCFQAKDLLNSINISFKDIDVTHDQETLNEASARSGMNTVPQVFMGDTCLGGCSEIEALHKKGELLKMYEKFKAEAQ